MAGSLGKLFSGMHVLPGFRLWRGPTSNHEPEGLLLRSIFNSSDAFSTRNPPPNLGPDVRDYKYKICSDIQPPFREIVTSTGGQKPIAPSRSQVPRRSEIRTEDDGRHAVNLSRDITGRIISGDLVRFQHAGDGL